MLTRQQTHTKVLLNSKINSPAGLVCFCLRSCARIKELVRIIK